MLAKEENSVEVQIWIKDDNVRKVFIKSAIKTLPVIFFIFFAYFFYQYAFVSLRFFNGNTKGFSAFILIIFIMASAISVLYAVGSGFQKVSALEKASPKTRIIFSPSKIEFIQGSDSNEKSWTDFLRIKETVDGFRLYPNDAKSFFIKDLFHKSVFRFLIVNVFASFSSRQNHLSMRSNALRFSNTTGYSQIS